MKLHIFNPEHEMALATDASHYVLPHKIQEFRMNLGFLPALWAEDGDCVLVDDAAYAIKALAATGLGHSDVLFLTDKELGELCFTEVDAWGWDKALLARLQRAGVKSDALPSTQELHNIRMMANRKLTTDVLLAVGEGMGGVVCGKSFYVDNIKSVERLLSIYEDIVLKAPWSSSGRGVRYLSSSTSANTIAWVEGVIRRQGGIMVEPHYVCVSDFAMEFYSDGGGEIDYRGLSVFHTEHGNYAGNIIATEEEKLRILSRYLEPSLIENMRTRLARFFSKAFYQLYRGLFGVDMMVVASGEGGAYKLHPCVEINLRRTMGHVANDISLSATDPVR